VIDNLWWSLSMTLARYHFLPRIGRAADLLPGGRDFLSALALCLALAGPLGGVFPLRAEPVLHSVADEGVVRALIIGIDKYQYVSNLSGAVADARDIHQTLRASGTGDLTLLLDGQATRRAVEAAFEALLSRVRPSDLVIIAFAGHGSQEPARAGSAEPDGKDEFFVLSGFGSVGEATKERILDDEMFGWLGRLASTGAQTIYLADSCHGGGLTKAPDAAKSRVGVRGLQWARTEGEVGPGAYFIRPGEDRLSPAANIPVDDDATRDFSSLTFLAGADDQTVVTEVKIPTEASTRGAASYAFSHALRGAADERGNRNGATTRAELMAFMRREVSDLSDSRQRIVMEPKVAASAQVVLFRTGPLAAAARPAPAVKPTAREMPGTIVGTTTAAGEPSHLEYVRIDGATGNISTADGTVLAFGLPPEEVHDVAEGLEAVARFKSLQARNPLTAGLKPPAASYADGDRFQVEAGGLYGKHLLILHLARGGELRVMFPRGDADPLMSKDVVAIPVKVGAPFGAETLVVLATSERSRELESDLTALSGKKAAFKAWQIAAQHLTSTDRVGVIEYRTRPR
jgi:hypothetical protein